jgi:hypothetical protein
LRTNNLNRVFIDGNGNVGIGTNNPINKLDLLGDLILGTPNNNYYGRANFKTFSGGIGQLQFIDTNISPYTFGGGGGILLLVSTQWSGDDNTGLFLYYIRKIYGTAIVWTSSSTTLATLVNIVGGPDFPRVPQDFSVSANNTIQFRFNRATNYRCLSIDF